MNKMTLAFASITALGMAAAAQADSIQLGFINTNDTNCGKAQSEISILNSPTAQVSAVCSDYVQGGYASDNGQTYDYRLTTTVTIAGTIASGTVIQMGHIDTDNPAYAQSEIQLLNSKDAQVDVTVAGPGSYPATNGRVYAYRLTTTVTAK
jgi:hypothetical protein